MTRSVVRPMKVGQTADLLNAVVNEWGSLFMYMMCLYPLSLCPSPFKSHPGDLLDFLLQVAPRCLDINHGRV